jgi:hypothetical protein
MGHDQLHAADSLDAPDVGEPPGERVAALLLHIVQYEFPGDPHGLLIVRDLGF